MNELKDIKEAVTKQSLNLNDIMKISFLSDDYKLTRQCVCGFKYKEMIEIKEHFDKNDTGKASTSSMFIVNPFLGGGLMALFSTHPPMAQRIARLREMSQKRF